jgi:hypothetical protein
MAQDNIFTKMAKTMTKSFEEETVNLHTKYKDMQKQQDLHSMCKIYTGLTDMDTYYPGSLRCIGLPSYAWWSLRGEADPPIKHALGASHSHKSPITDYMRFRGMDIPNSNVNTVLCFASMLDKAQNAKNHQRRFVRTLKKATQLFGYDPHYRDGDFFATTYERQEVTYVVNVRVDIPYDTIKSLYEYRCLAQSDVYVDSIRYSDEIKGTHNSDVVNAVLRVLDGLRYGGKTYHPLWIPRVSDVISVIRMQLKSAYEEGELKEPIDFIANPEGQGLIKYSTDTYAIREHIMQTPEAGKNTKENDKEQKNDKEAKDTPKHKRSPPDS